MDAPAALTGGPAASGVALEPHTELLVRLRQRRLHVEARLARASKLLLLPRLAQYAVEYLRARSQRDTIVGRGEQEVQPDERPAKEVELGHGEIFEVRGLELLPLLFFVCGSSWHGCGPPLRDPRA